MNPPPVDDIIHHFHTLARNFSHPPTGKSHIWRDRYQAEQVNLYHLAQVITARCFPDVQSDLDQCRRRVIDQIIKGPLDSKVAILNPRYVPSKFVRWNEYQITP